MKTKMKAYTVKHRRRREAKTDYKQRLRLLSSNKFRVVIKRGINNFLVQFIQYGEKGDKVLVSVHSRELLKYGWELHRGNMSAAYLSGYLCGLKAKKSGIKNCIIDFGTVGAIKKSSLFAVVKGLIDAGIDLPYSKEALPDQETISGKKVVDYALVLKNNKDLYSKQFSSYDKKGIKVEETQKIFQNTKTKIGEKWQ